MNIARFAFMPCVALAAACAAPGPDAAPLAERLAGTKWVGTSEPDADRRTVPRVEFGRDGRMSGYTGCNLMSATFTMEGDRLVLGPVATTKRACPGPVGDREQQLLEILSADPRLRLGRHGLALEGGNGRRFEFVEAPPSY